MGGGGGYISCFIRYLINIVQGFFVQILARKGDSYFIEFKRTVYWVKIHPKYLKTVKKKKRSLIFNISKYLKKSCPEIKCIDL